MPHSSPKRTINRHFFAPLLSCVIPNCTWLCYEGKFEKVLPRLAFSEPPSPVPVFPLVPFVTLLVIPLGKIHGKIWERYHFFPNLIHQSLRILPHAAPEKAALLHYASRLHFLTLLCEDKPQMIYTLLMAIIAAGKNPRQKPIEVRVFVSNI